ncbi:beta-centractin [Salpingoeca rosetta]|uniref:Beta-centractin n=1 Tax=Salpingoeca rosetta (strain ATCC 50818 / BSB-021) TaxID=946362 RepID=F2UJ75_SALR5|nr:beta-centractin [Salpingoeca rosetta]EGD77023.1 beta-centractin [Salpingoeca rosetta]|eukprot:XP_004990863.1 beta-centractin [Salpingoeca rosetta]
MADYTEVLQNPPVVIDNGSGIIKAGFAADQLPKTIPAYVGRVKHERVMAGTLEEEFIGQKAKEHRGLLKLNYPMEHGIVNDEADMKKIWNHVYQKLLNVQPEEHPVLLTEAPLNPRRNREWAAETFFEALGVPALFISMQAVLSLYASGNTTGVVLDCGDGVTHAVPVYEGFAVKNAIRRIDVAGRDVTRHLQLLLRREGHIFKTSAEFEVVRTIKEKACFVSDNAEKEDARTDRAPTRYRLPDGREIMIEGARYRAPEVLFNPEIIGEECEGVHKVLTYSIQKSDLDLRRALYQGIVLSGGSTRFEGFGQRLLKEVRADAPKDIKIKIMAPPERQFSTWLGGSILASLDTFRRIWVSKAEYSEVGPSIIHRKMFL